MTNNFSSSIVLEVWAMTQFALQIILHIQAQLVTETTSGSLKGCSKQLLASFARSCLVSCKAIAFVQRLRGLSLFLSFPSGLSKHTYLLVLMLLRNFSLSSPVSHCINTEKFSQYHRQSIQVQWVSQWAKEVEIEKDRFAVAERKRCLEKNNSAN